MAERLLEGKAALVTGGAQGIGLAIARAFLGHGASVTLADVAHDLLGPARAALAPSGPVATALLDVTDPEATERLAAELAAAGGTDILVVNAGILALAPAVELPLADWRRVIEVNLTGAFVTATTFARAMIARGEGGRIILTSSLFGLRGGVENAAYSASKFGMIGLMQCLAAELAPHGILVNAVCPGQIRTAMMDRLFQDRARLQGGDPASLEAAFTRRIPLGRLGTPAEVADTFVYLASDLGRYVVGQSLVVDGGWQVG